MIRALFDAGADVFRLNFSHGEHDTHEATLNAIRAVESETGRPIGIIADLQGPKLRIGDLIGGSVMLEKGASSRSIRVMSLVTKPAHPFPTQSCSKPCSHAPRYPWTTAASGCWSSE